MQSQLSQSHREGQGSFKSTQRNAIAKMVKQRGNGGRGNLSIPSGMQLITMSSLYVQSWVCQGKD